MSSHKKTKKILFTSHVASFQKFNRPFMRMMSEKGWEVHYASMGEEEILDCDKSFVVPFTRSPFRLSNITAYRQLKKIINQENYDIIHTHTPMGSVVTRLAAKKARKNGTKIIYTAHGFHFFKGAPLLNWLIYYPVERLMARHTDTLITINKEDYHRAKKQFKTNVIYMPGVGVDPKRFKPKLTAKQKLELRKSLGLKKDDFVMIYPAELSKRKNQLWLIEALRPLLNDDTKVHLILAGKDSLHGKVTQHVNQYDLANQVHILGYRNDIHQLLQIANLSVSSSKQEGLPVHIMEAMFAGLPIVTIKCRGATELVEDGVNGFVVGFDKVEFVERVQKIIKDRKLRLCLATNSLKRIDRYALFGISELMHKLYSNITKKKILHLLASNKFSGAENVACEIIQHTPSEYNSMYCSPPGDINDVLKSKNITKIDILSLSKAELRRVVKNHNPDTIHAHDFRASILASKFHRRAKIISHIHQKPEWLNKPFDIRSVVYRTRVRNIDLVLLVTHAVKNTMLFRKISSNKLTVLHNFIDKNKIVKLSKSVKTKRYDIAFCGRLEDIKQPLDFIKIVEEVKKYNSKVKAVIVGDGSLRNACNEHIEKHDLTKSITMTGFVNNPYPYIKNSKYLVITSKNEGFGLVAAEATMLNTAVVSYLIPAISELLGDNEAYRLSSYNSIANFIEKDDSISRKNRIRQAAGNLSKSTYDSERDFDNLIYEIYKGHNE